MPAAESNAALPPELSIDFLKATEEELSRAVDKLFDMHEKPQVPQNRSLLGGLLHAKPPLKLPQGATEHELSERQKALKNQREHFQYNYALNVPEAPMLAKTGLDQLPSREWRRKLVRNLLRMRGHNHLTLIKSLIEDPTKLFSLIPLVVQLPDDQTYTRPQKVEDFDRYFDELPKSAHELDLDAAFCRYRLAGPNPVTIEKVTSKEALMAKANIASLNPEANAAVMSALAEGRLFISDYTVMAQLKSAKLAGYQKYSVGPLALFEMPKDSAQRRRESLVPLAIQCENMDPQKPAPPMFTPADGMMKWKIAKAVLNSADGDYHEAIAHLAFTHLCIESLMVGTHRQLPQHHPLYALLLPHFEGTGFINDLADKTLINPGGIVDHLVSADIYDLNAYVGKQVQAILSQDFSFPAMIKRRNMDSENFPAPYPYRDDGQLVWDAIRVWVNDYLALYYSGSEAEAAKMINADSELQGWLHELSSERGGCVRWMNSFDGSLRMLVDFVAGIIFTASAQHAAVNFPQEPLESYVPAFPLALYRRPPGKDEQSTEADYLATLPPVEMQVTQKRVANLLGGIYHTMLGQYEAGHFTDVRVEPFLKKFQQALAEAGRVIEQRNKERVEAWNNILPKETAKNWTYEYLLPQNIPQSINI